MRGTYVCAGNVNLLTQGRLSSHRGTSYAGISNAANTLQIPGKRFWPACPPALVRGGARPAPNGCSQQWEVEAK